MAKSAVKAEPTSKTAVDAKISKKGSLSEEIVVDSSSDNDSSEVEEEDEDEDSLDESDPSEKTTKPQIKASPSKVEARRSSGEVEDDDDTASTVSSTEPSSSSDDEDHAQKSNVKSVTNDIRKELHVAKEQPRPEYVPPPGFSKIGSYKDALILDATSLGEKEVWHITVPAGLPVSSIQTISLEGLHSNATILSHKGNDYSFLEENSSTNSNKALVLPQTTDKKFKAHPKSVARTLHLRQSVKLPGLSKPKQADSSTNDGEVETTRLAVTSIRPQPKGMKMRYKPPGFGSGRAGTIGSDSSTDGSDTEMEDLQPTFRHPKPSGSTKSERANGGEATPNKKRKRADGKEASVATPAEKGKKSKTAKAQATAPTPKSKAGADSDEDEEDEEGGQDTSKPRLSLAEKEAKRQRKAERALKRQRKEEKRKAKAGS